MKARDGNAPATVETTGHEWDGIQELNNPLPRWWLWIFYATVAFAVVYMILFPAIPLPTGSGYSQGTLGWSSRAKVEREIGELEASRAAVLKDIETIPLAELRQNAALWNAAIEGGRSAFRVHCVQCHGSGAAGGMGYPNLNDDEWLWGGSVEDIHRTLLHGIRHPGDPDTRQSMMPAFGRDGLLSAREIDEVVEHVRAISGQEHNAAMAARGSATFAQQCASCHGEDGKGIRDFGSPNLTNGIWLYGGDRATLRETIYNARAGVMPGWNDRLSEATIRKLTAYVHSLGGGE